MKPPNTMDKKDYKKIKLLGEGSYGKAYLVERIIDNQLCVIKQIDISHMTDQEKCDAINEANILQILNHHNIIKYHEQFKTKKNKLCIVMDYAEGGDLSQIIQKQQIIKEEQIIDWLTQICCALNLVHSKNIIHRDIKSQNIFLTQNKIIKLADFGIAKILSCTRDKAKTFIGTPYYLAPELIQNKPYTTKVDIWSLGVLIYELCALKQPFDAGNMHALVLKIIKGVYNPIPGGNLKNEERNKDPPLDNFNDQFFIINKKENEQQPSPPFNFEKKKNALEKINPVNNFVLQQQTPPFVRPNNNVRIGSPNTRLPQLNFQPPQPIIPPLDKNKLFNEGQKKEVKDVKRMLIEFNEMNLKKYLEKEIGTMHFSKAYKLALSAFEKQEDFSENSPFFYQFQNMFPTLNQKYISKYSTLLYTLVMIEKTQVAINNN
ncbi:protein kinase domain protein [Ichthyophthirius multifiliis]|uniref:non-specific serine/threonine protein kinase n=1 Tax=Ichthyophthirius multifiliis TaxID=5932 RepID=G0R5S6_ICHMU|nr:protein kinase domain protein [Ichthyophthirius multifiliis]EGR27184.1 protein kinase domain protein [Ichthyophthirius multifiliis]|eukprot:XP_004024068.1 protein kinase domain protein [Ichthyophthirius multifiliis]